MLVGSPKIEEFELKVYTKVSIVNAGITNVPEIVQTRSSEVTPKSLPLRKHNKGH